MTYTTDQIERAKKAYNKMLNYRTVESYEPEFIGWNTAEQRCEDHNSIVRAICSGNKELEKEWKLFFLKLEVKADQKAEEKKSKLEANMTASANILVPIREARKMTAFGKWLNTTGNPFRKEYFSKRYSQESVNEFLLNN